MTGSTTILEIPRELQLATISNLEGYLYDSSDHQAYEHYCSLDRFLETLQQSRLKYEKYRLYFNNDSFLTAIKGKRVYATSLRINGEDAFPLDINQYTIPSAIILTKCPKKESNKNIRLSLLVNADAGSLFDRDIPPESIVDEVSSYEFPSISFRCLAQFYLKNGSLQNCIMKVIKKFESGTLVVVDYNPDEYISISSDDNRKYKKWLRKYDKTDPPISPPEKGFTYLITPGTSGRWHRPSTVILFDKEAKKTFLLGQDEGQYFGVELPKHAKSVGQAIDCLIPKEAKGKDYRRQGEWFIVPVDPETVPEEKDCLAICHSEGCALPLSEDNENIHYLYGEDIRVSDKLYARNPCLIHGEHSDARHKGWCTFYRNTALRSVSVEGVD